MMFYCGLMVHITDTRTQKVANKGFVKYQARQGVF